MSDEQQGPALGGAAAEFERLRQRLGFSSEPAPKIDGRYQRLRSLGHGAMGEVLLAHDHRLGRTVALKVVRNDGAIDTATLRARLEREALALARVDDPNVVRIFDVGSQDGQTYFTMQFVPGATLRDWQTGRPRRELLAAYLQAARGLAAAHAVAVVHRDFKPDNAIVGDDGVVRVLDFGIAAPVRSDDAVPVELPVGPEVLAESGGLDAETSTARAQRSLATMTRPGTLLGTLPYMASEQLAGQRADARSDQYAFCVALWEALAGQRPFPGRSPDALLRGIAAGPGPGGVTLRWLRAILVRGLAEDPRRRWPDMRTLVAAIERGRRMHRLAQVALGIVAAAAVVIAGVWAYGLAVRAAADTRADARLAVLRERLVERGSHGDHTGAAQLLRSFVELSDNRDTAAVARAQLAWGDAQSDDAVAVDAYASAYMAARTPADAHAALRGLVLRLYARDALQESTAALAVLLREDPGAGDDPTLAPVRLAGALHRRDFAAASAVLASGPEPGRAWIPVLEDLSHITVHTRERLGIALNVPVYLRAADIDGDGRAEFVSNSYGPDGSTAIILRGEPELRVWGRIHWPEPVTDVILLPHAFAGAPMLMSAHPVGPQFELRMSRVVDGAPEAVATWQEGGESRWFCQALADLDGDGALELYLGNGPYARRLWRIDPGPDGWTRRSANLATDAAQSDVTSIVAGDLDGDGRDELVVSAAPWDAYDIRVLRARADARPGHEDTLELVARRTFGPIVQVALPRTRTGRRIAFVKNDGLIAPDRFPADRPLGETRGLYVAELRGETIEVVEHVPVPRSSQRQQQFDRVIAGDLDGDGEDELITSLESGRGMVLLRWHDGRLQPPLVVSGLWPGLVLDLDDDGRDEIVAADVEHDRVVVLGAGDERLRATPVFDQVRPVPAGISEPAAVDAWRRADELAAIGVPRRTADELAAFARLSGHAAEDLLLRAAELYESTGAHALAADNYLAAAARPELADKALAGAIRGRRQLGEFAAAAELAARRLRSPSLTPAGRAEADAELAALRRATAPRPELHLDFAAELDPMWRVVDPLAIRRDPGRRALSLWAARTPVTADYPIAWDGGPLSLEVDLEIDDLEWSCELFIGLAGPDTDAPWLGLQLFAQGSNVAPRSVVTPRVQGRVMVELAELRAGSRLRARVTILPELASTIADIEIDGRHQRQVHALPSSTEPHGSGPLRLIFGNGDGLSSEYTGHVWVRDIRLSGVTAGARVDTGEPAARMLAELEFVGVDLALRAASAGPALLWRAEALAELGAVDEAAALIAAVPEDSPEYAALIHRARRGRDPFTLAARAGLGPRWADVVIRNGSAPRPVDELAALTDWPTVHGEPPADATPRQRTRHAWMLALRARAQLTFGHIEAADRDLRAALVVLADESHASPERVPLHAMVAETQVRVAAERGDPEALRAALARILAGSRIPEIELEKATLDPKVRALLGPDDLAALRREYRSR